MDAKRASAYGQNRKFRGLEQAAIRRRQHAARQALATLTANERREIKVLELGCGYTGQNLALLSTDFPLAHYTGVDVSVVGDQEAVTKVELLQADLETWQPDRQYDLVLSLAVVEHLLNPLRHFALIAECLTSSGLALLTTPTPPADVLLRLLAALGIFDKDEILDHKTYLTKTGIHYFAQRAALRVENYHLLSLGMNHVLHLRREAA